MSFAHDLSANTGFFAATGAPPVRSILPAESKEESAAAAAESDDLPETAPDAERPLHRLAEVRRQQGVSIRSAARRMGVTAEQVKREENDRTNLRLTDIYRWQRALDVPAGDLLDEVDAPLSGPVLQRARMVRIMKTVRAIGDESNSPKIDRMVLMLENQMLELMPELEDVGAWHSVGQRRTQDEMGRIAERPISDSFVSDGLH